MDRSLRNSGMSLRSGKTLITATETGSPRKGRQKRPEKPLIVTFKEVPIQQEAGGKGDATPPPNGRPITRPTFQSVEKVRSYQDLQGKGDAGGATQEQLTHGGNVDILSSIGEDDDPAEFEPHPRKLDSGETSMTNRWGWVRQMLTGITRIHWVSGESKKLLTRSKPRRESCCWDWTVWLFVENFFICVGFAMFLAISAFVIPMAADWFEAQKTFLKPL